MDEGVGILGDRRGRGRAGGRRPLRFENSSQVRPVSGFHCRAEGIHSLPYGSGMGPG